MGKPLFDFSEVRRIYEEDHQYCIDYLPDESNYYVFERVLRLATKYGWAIDNEVRWRAVNGPEPDSDDDRSSGAPTPRYHPADLYADEPQELLLLAAHAGGGSSPLPEEQS